MHKLGITDASFLYMESPASPMNIGSVQLLDVPARETFFDELKCYLAARVHAIPFMCKRLKSTPLTLDQPVWVADTTFAIDNHVSRVKLGAPGSWAQLEAMVARLHEAPLPRNRPLWAFYYIEGLASGQVAWFSKYHHACIDGMAGQGIIDILFSKSAATDPPLVEAAHDEPEPGALDLVLDAARSLFDQSFSWTVANRRAAQGHRAPLQSGHSRSRGPRRAVWRSAAHAVQPRDQPLSGVVGRVVAAARAEGSREIARRDHERRRDGGVRGRVASLPGAQPRVAGRAVALWRAGVAARARRYDDEQSGHDAGGDARNRRRRPARASARDQSVDAAR